MVFLNMFPINDPSASRMRSCLSRRSTTALTVTARGLGNRRPSWRRPARSHTTRARRRDDTPLQLDDFGWRVLLVVLTEWRYAIELEDVDHSIPGVLKNAIDWASR